MLRTCTAKRAIFQVKAWRRWNSTNPQMAFPCVDRAQERSQLFQEAGFISRKPGMTKTRSTAKTTPSALRNEEPATAIKEPATPVESGPEPIYGKIVSGYKVFQYNKPFLCDHGGVLPRFDIAYESWGRLNADKSNAILLHTGLSASSHAHSHEANTQPGWWEKFIGPGKDLDTNKFFIICTNVIGSCYGSTGPASIDPSDNRHYATRFPTITVFDMVRAQTHLLDKLGIDKLYASVGSSLGGMQSLALGAIAPHRVGRIASISGAARSHPYSIALRFTQRQILMNDPHWNHGFYYNGVPPHVGMKLAREVATISYRSGPEWEQRFGMRRADPSADPALCPDFLIETYLDHAGEKFCTQYDPNSLLYISKAMDMFDMSASQQATLAYKRSQNMYKVDAQNFRLESSAAASKAKSKNDAGVERSSGAIEEDDLVEGMRPLRDIPTLVMGVRTDNLMPVNCQREAARCLRKAGNKHVHYHELDEQKSLFGHDTFLIYRNGCNLVGDKLKSFLEERF
ncbi:homoserine O-acetyltransferase [Schizosaccharomyces japonicus yFS275]|uniref:Homoserine O-acetyltransferase n=1 Tax=Schizosaccharomyces japonicus (strain yFS275 / FY16936) TaxID=402676 RepID=B6K6H3_SCHJY|nr:homoserine O-acetyltransferase [Schizosaccharomyces japonicus yFS275]EEB09127.1 homoserine O-acetyltransferase [Schizosaccharomyces japonicus yFS275]